MKTFALLFVSLGLLAGTVSAESATVTATTLAPVTEAYEAGRRALDRGQWQQARDKFDEATKSGANVDAALYWKAYAEMKMKDYAASKATIAGLKAGFPKSEWIDDAEALTLEMRGRRSQEKLPEDDELKLYALQMLMINDPERAEPLLKKYIEEGKSDELREKAMFILLQHPDAANSDLLKGALSQAANIQLKMSAIRLLGMLDDEKSRALLDRAYKESTEQSVKHMIIQAYMTQDNAERLAEIARTEKDPGLQRQAVTMLGVQGEIGRIRDLYKSTKDPGVRAAMMQGFAIAGEGEFLLEILEKETDKDLRLAAVNHLIMVDLDNAGVQLEKIYASSQSREEKQALIRTMAMSDNADTLIKLYKTEKDAGVRREILQAMAMFSDDSRVADFFEEFLQEN